MEDREHRRTLRDLRNEKGLTQDELAARAGVAWATIAKLELGDHEPTLDTLKSLSKVLGHEVLDVEYGWRRPPRRRTGKPRKPAGESTGSPSNSQEQD